MLYFILFLLSFVAGAVVSRTYAAKLIADLTAIAADAKKAEIAARDAGKG